MENKKTTKTTAPIVESSDEITVSDPMVLKPKELPLVVTLPSNASGAQKEYARILNAYAYQNPEKWAEKKDILIKRLKSYANLETLNNQRGGKLVIGGQNNLGE